MQMKFIVYIGRWVAAHEKLKKKNRDFAFTVDRCASRSLNNGIVKLVQASSEPRN